MASSSGFSEVLSDSEEIKAYEKPNPIPKDSRLQQQQQTSSIDDADAATNADTAAGPAEARRAGKHYDAKAVTAVFPPVILTMHLAIISAKTWMWEPLKKSDSGMLSAKSLGGGEGGGGNDGGESDTAETIKVDDFFSSKDSEFLWGILSYTKKRTSAGAR